jgi:hypothetical protein
MSSSKGGTGFSVNDPEIVSRSGSAFVSNGGSFL